MSWKDSASLNKLEQQILCSRKKLFKFIKRGCLFNGPRFVSNSALALTYPPRTPKHLSCSSSSQWMVFTVHKPICKSRTQKILNSSFSLSIYLQVPIHYIFKQLSNLSISILTGITLFLATTISLGLHSVSWVISVTPVFSPTGPLSTLPG